MKSLFTYGTLMSHDIMQMVSGLRQTGVSARLEGFTRWSIKDEHYPAIVPDDIGTIVGIVYHNIFDKAWRRLDRFEGSMYHRKTVTITLNDGSSMAAETYVIKPRYYHLLDKTEWDPQAFHQQGKIKFLKRYQGFHRLY